MKTPQTRRAFLAEVGRGMLVASVGLETAQGLKLAAAVAEENPGRLTFGDLEPLVGLMQDTASSRLLPALVKELNAGTSLRQLVAAAALANARTFGGEDYVGFHTMMALSPALHMAAELTPERQALPVLKVLHRNTHRIQETGGAASEVLRAVQPCPLPEDAASVQLLQQAIHGRDVRRAEQVLAAIRQRSAGDAFNDLLHSVQEKTEVHRVVLPYRAWDLLELIGKEQALTLLRQSVRYCVKAEGWPSHESLDKPRTLLPRLLEEYRLLDRSPGPRRAEDGWIDEFSQTLFASTAEQAADAAAAALAEGMSPHDVGEALALAANQLVLRDRGRPPSQEVAGKPVGSVHGDSIGVHACDSANAWRHMIRATHARNTFASLILGAYQVALDRVNRGGDFLEWDPLPVPRHVREVTSSDPGVLIRELDLAIRDNLQGKASAIVHRHGQLGHGSRPVFDLLLRYAVSEDGALHGEKFYRTVTEEFASTRPAFRWRHLVALARVTASEYGRPAPGMEEARALLKL